MKYYSDVTKKLYESVEDLKKAEAEITDKAAARKKDADKVEKAYNAYIEARKEYEKVLTEFCNKHGAYHKTYTSKDAGDVKTEFESLRNLVSMLIGE